MQICAFLWIYYGYPASNYEGVTRGRALPLRRGPGARRHHAPDLVAGIPIRHRHAIGYAAEAGIPYRRPFVKYTPRGRGPSCPRSSACGTGGPDEAHPVRELIEGSRSWFCEDSIVRGTQLKDLISRIFDAAPRGPMRPACRPRARLPFLNFSQSRSELDLAAAAP